MKEQIMQMRKLGPSGIDASVVALGTWAIGGWMWGGTDRSESIGAIQAAIDEGITLIDTAPAYGLGLAEEIVGQAIAGRREKVIVATKCGLVWHTDGGVYFFDENGHRVHRYLAAASIRHEVEQSLRRLRTETIDLYQTHWQDPTTPIEESMSVLLDLKREGKIRAIGVSNVTVGELASYRKVGPVDSDQEKYSMLDRGIEAELLPCCRAHSIAMLAYAPLASGVLTGRIGPDRTFENDDHRRSNPRFSVENRQRIQTLLATFEPIAEAHRASVSQIVIAWTAAQSGVTHVLCGARNASQARENAAAGRIVLTANQCAAIDAALAGHASQIV
jgi:aryl-alcohol dehydrogenase-like predicted oxidoreductase